MCFSANVGRHYFLDFQGFCPYFQGFCPDFRQIKTHGVALSPPSPPAPTPLAEDAVNYWQSV